MERISELELARQAFLLVLCEVADDDAGVKPWYLAEKVTTIYRARHVWEIVSVLDLSGQRRFRRIFAGLGGVESTALPDDVGDVTRRE